MTFIGNPSPAIPLGNQRDANDAQKNETPGLSGRFHFFVVTGRSNSNLNPGTRSVTGEIPPLFGGTLPRYKCNAPMLFGGFCICTGSGGVNRVRLSAPCFSTGSRSFFNRGIFTRHALPFGGHFIPMFFIGTPATNL